MLLSPVQQERKNKTTAWGGKFVVVMTALLLLGIGGIVYHISFSGVSAATELPARMSFERQALGNWSATPTPSPSSSESGWPSTSASPTMSGSSSIEWDPSKSKSPVSEPSKSKSPVSEPSKSNSPVSDPSKSKSGGGEASKSKSGGGEPSKSSSGGGEPSKSNSGGGEPSKSNSGGGEPSKSSSGGSEPSKSGGGGPTNSRSPQPQYSLSPFATHSPHTNPSNNPSPNPDASKSTSPPPIYPSKSQSPGPFYSPSKSLSPQSGVSPGSTPSATKTQHDDGSSSSSSGDDGSSSSTSFSSSSSSSSNSDPSDLEGAIEVVISVEYPSMADLVQLADWIPEGWVAVDDGRTPGLTAAGIEAVGVVTSATRLADRNSNVTEGKIKVTILPKNGMPIMDTELATREAEMLCNSTDSPGSAKLEKLVSVKVHHDDDDDDDGPSTLFFVALFLLVLGGLGAAAWRYHRYALFKRQSPQNVGLLDNYSSLN